VNRDEYWIGEGIDYDTLWDAYDDGIGYIDKFRSMDVHLLRITFAEPPSSLPLFNFEAIYKTVKGYFHDIKSTVLSEEEFATAGPLFLYRVDRGSGIWDFLGELRQLVMLGTTLSDEQAMGQRLANLEARIEFLRRHFGDAVRPEDFEAFMNARTPRKLDKAFRRLTEQRIQSVELSQTPFTGSLSSVDEAMIELKALSEHTPTDDQE
jgi:hypothetical protein